MQAVTIDRIRQDSAGRIHVHYGKQALEFPDLLNFRTWVQSSDDQLGLPEHFLIRQLVRAAVKAGGGLAAIRAAAEGKTAALDLDAGTLTRG